MPPYFSLLRYNVTLDLIVCCSYSQCLISSSLFNSPTDNHWIDEQATAYQNVHQILFNYPMAFTVKLQTNTLALVYHDRGRIHLKLRYR